MLDGRILVHMQLFSALTGGVVVYVTVIEIPFVCGQYKRKSLVQ